MTVARMLLRIGLIAAAAALVIGLTGIYARSIRPRPQNRFQFAERRRAPEPRPRAFPAFVSQAAVFGLLAVAGRKVLRIRLTE